MFPVRPFFWVRPSPFSKIVPNFWIWSCDLLAYFASFFRIVLPWCEMVWCLLGLPMCPILLRSLALNRPVHEGEHALAKFSPPLIRQG